MSESTSTGGRTRLFLQVSAIALAAVGISERKAEAAPGIADGGITIDVQGQYVFNATGPSNGPFPGSPGLSDPYGNTGGLKPGDGYAINGTITYQQPGSPWSFGVGVRYGRMKGKTGNSHLSSFSNGYYSKYYKSFSQDTHARLHDSTHYAVDFMVGHDVGVGLFGRGVTTVGAGIRYAHFDSTITGSFSTHSKYFYSSFESSSVKGASAQGVSRPKEFVFDSFNRSGTFSVRHNTDAVGPMLYVNTVSPFPGDTGFSFVGGIGAGVLFGRQTVHSDVHLTSGTYAGVRVNRSRSSTIPTVDGFMQISWSPPKSPLSVGVGYRVDAYFTAIDGGFETSHEVDSVEHGPYLDITVRIP